MDERTGRVRHYDASTGHTFYEELYERLIRRGVARLFLARHSVEVIPALFNATLGGRAYSVFSGRTEVRYKVGERSGLFWAGVDASRVERARELNRGDMVFEASVGHQTKPLSIRTDRIGRAPRCFIERLPFALTLVRGE